jgi:hypothetical protein
VRLSPSRSRDRERIDRVGLSRLSSTAANAGHELGWNANDLLARTQHVAFQCARQMPAVLQRPASTRPPRRPGQRRQMSLGRRAQGLHSKLSAEFVSCDQRVRALVRVDSDHDLCQRFHQTSPRHYDRTCRSRGREDMPQSRDRSGSYEVTPGHAAAPSERHDKRRPRPPIGQHGNEPTRRAQHPTLALRHGKHQPAAGPQSVRWRAEVESEFELPPRGQRPPRVGARAEACRRSRRAWARWFG